jgi:DNA-binding NarL/FixJ family response regulator
MESCTGAVLSDSGLFRDAMGALLAQQGTRQVLALKDSPGLFTALGQHPLRWVLVDLGMGAEDPFYFLDALRNHVSRPKLIVVGTRTQVASAGASEAALTTPYADGKTLKDAVEAALAGRFLSVAEPEGSPRLPKEDPRLWARVTARQHEVLGWLAVGADNQRISQTMGITVRTVKAHVSLLMRKFDVQNRTELALLGIEIGARPPAAAKTSSVSPTELPEQQLSTGG